MNTIAHNGTVLGSFIESVGIYSYTTAINVTEYPTVKSTEPPSAFQDGG